MLPKQYFVLRHVHHDVEKKRFTYSPRHKDAAIQHYFDLCKKHNTKKPFPVADIYKMDRFEYDGGYIELKEE